MLELDYCTIVQEESYRYSKRRLKIVSSTVVAAGRTLQDKEDWVEEEGRVVGTKKRICAIYAHK